MRGIAEAVVAVFIHGVLPDGVTGWDCVSSPFDGSLYCDVPEATRTASRLRREIKRGLYPGYDRVAIRKLDRNLVITGAGITGAHAVMRAKELLDADDALRLSMKKIKKGDV